MIVGAGPAGLFAGYLLAQSGYRPLILERGRAVKDRVADVRRFDEHGPLDPESNYLFGEGGAGTFSDGKLTSRGTGPDVTRVLEILAECHGKPSIVYEHRPHLGSNRLPLVVRTLRRKFEALGGEVRFSCRVEDLDIADGRLRGLAHVVGLHRRRRGDPGDRPQRPRHLRHAAAPRRADGAKAVPARRADRAAAGADRPGAIRRQRRPSRHWARPTTAPRSAPARRDLFTFCMCAGGYVMPSVSEPGYFCTNGMSESRHDSPFANSGLVVTIEPDETGSSHPLAGVHYQQRVERLAYLAGGRVLRGAAPVGSRLPRGPAEPGQDSRPAIAAAAGPIDLGLFLPDLVIEALVAGFPSMDRRFGGHFLRDATLTGPEVARQLAGADHPRSGNPREPRHRRALSLRRRGRLRRRDHQRGRRRPAHRAGDRREVRQCLVR